MSASAMQGGHIISVSSAGAKSVQTFYVQTTKTVKPR